MKLLIAGSRTISPSLADIDDALAELVRQEHALLGPGAITHVISGGARGVDYAGELWAHARVCGPSCPRRRDARLTCEAVIKVLADWTKYGKPAGPIRNGTMAKECDIALVWWDEESGGTADMIAKLERTGKPRLVRVWPARLFRRA